MNEDNANVATDELTDFQKEVVSFKVQFAHELHRLVDLADACTTFDSLMNGWGLPARWRYQEGHVANEYGDEYHYDGDDIVTAEATQEDAERWLRQTSRAITEATDSYGYRELYDPSIGEYVRLNDVLSRFGFPVREQMSVRVTGTFDIAVNVNGYQGDNLIDNVSRQQVAAAVRSAIDYGDTTVQWKASDPDADNE